MIFIGFIYWSIAAFLIYGVDKQLTNLVAAGLLVLFFFNILMINICLFLGGKLDQIIAELKKANEIPILEEEDEATVEDQP